MGVCITNNNPSNISHLLRRVLAGLVLTSHAGWHAAKGTR